MREEGLKKRRRESEMGVRERGKRVREKGRERSKDRKSQTGKELTSQPDSDIDKE